MSNKNFTDLMEFIKESKIYSEKVGAKEKLGEEQLGGQNAKFFGLIPDSERTISSSAYCKELWENLKNNTGCYRSIYDDWFKDGGDEIPKYVSAMVKHEVFDLKTAVREYVGSKVCSNLSSPTVFNTCFMAKDGDSCKPVSISVDCVKEGEAFYTIHEIMSENSANNSSWAVFGINKISEWFDYLDTDFENDLQHVSYTFDDLGNLRKNPQFEPKKEDLEKFKEDFTYQYLVRKIILADSDYGIMNAGVIFNKFGSMQLAPNFDMECAVLNYFNGADNDRLQEVLTEVCNRYPQVAKKLYENCKSFEKNIDSIVDSAKDLNIVGNDTDEQKNLESILNRMKSNLHGNTSLYMENYSQFNHNLSLDEQSRI